VTYQTAYLKANYPVEYMAALLTANSDDRDKVQMYIAGCLRMGIDVEPPDINRSGVDFTPLKGQGGKRGTILFGLGAVRNLGLGAIECLLAARNQDGPFKSLADLCDRIDLRSVNRRALEALVQCGALDRLEPNRRQAAEDLVLIVDWANSRAKDRASGQGSLFDFGMGGAADTNAPNVLDLAPKAAPVEDYPKQERLNLEKELLGFYISDHPLKDIQKPSKLLAPISLSELGDRADDKVTVSAIVMLNAVKPVVTKKGDRMAIVQIEDLTAQAEAIVFPRAYERIHEHIQPDRQLMIWGKVDRRDDSPQFIIEDAEPIERIQLLTIEISAELAGSIEQQHQLRTLLLDWAGEEAKTPVVAIVTGDDGRRELVRFGPQFRVRDASAATRALTGAGFTARATPLVGSR
jgi:DNA polymerase-3 subunit alpha